MPGIRGHQRVYLRELELEDEKFFVGSEEVVRVDIYGTIVNTRTVKAGTILSVDDRTGIIDCMKFHDDDEDELLPDTPMSDLTVFLSTLIKPKYYPQLGDLVNIRGRLNVFRSTPKIIIDNIRLVTDENEEWFRILEIEAQRKRCFKKCGSPDLQSFDFAPQSFSLVKSESETKPEGRSALQSPSGELCESEKESETESYVIPPLQ